MGISLQRTSVGSVRHSHPYPELLKVLTIITVPGISVSSVRQSEIPGTGMNAVQNLQKITEVPGKGMNVVQTSQKFFVGEYP